MRRPTLPMAALPVLLAVTSCGNPGKPSGWLGEVAQVTAVAGPGSRYPHLARSIGGPVVMSWLQARDDGGFALQFARWQGDGWGPAGTVATGADWFVNWADFPSVVPINAANWAAHWLQQTPGSVYSYDVRIAVSTDGGATWSAPSSPHDDGTPTEHGFVTLYADAGRARAVWLDGRYTAGGHEHAGHGVGAMTLRGATIGVDGKRVGDDVEIDGRVCDCCQTDVAITDDGPVLVYRDRGAGEIRDISLARFDGVSWTAPVKVHADSWTIDACPVNGPAVDARGRVVAVAWFTAPDRPRVRLAFSEDSGRTFAAPIEVADGDVSGRVDVALLDDGRAVVSWLQASSSGAEVRARPYSRTGPAGPAVVVADTSVQRSSGFPQMLATDGGLLFAWTDSAGPAQVRTAFAPVR